MTGIGTIHKTATVSSGYMIRMYEGTEFALEAVEVARMVATEGQQWRVNFHPDDQYALLLERVAVSGSGIARNLDVPRVGVISQRSIDSDALSEMYQDGINISYEDWQTTRREELRTEILGDEERALTEDEESTLDEALERESDMYESSDDQYIIGAWVKQENGTYAIDRSGKSGAFAATLGGSMGNVCVEWSQYTKRCGTTSPCYVMADGSGPCGDLDSKADTVVAYTLPADYLAD